jgi:predicted ATPase
MVRGLLDTDPLPGALESMAVARADGNPFFIEQLIRHLVEDGTLVRTSERWIASPRPDARSVPDSIHALLAARIDALAASEKRVLQQAALVGRIFWDEPLVQTLGRPVDGELLGLERKGLIFPRPGSEFGGSREFAFKHALVRDVAYATVPKVRRAREHAQIAAWFESIARDATDELAEVVADHYAEAVSSDPDLAWEGDADGWETVRQHAYAALMRAGDGVRKRWVLSRATDYHVRALHLAVDEDERQRALVALENDQIWFPFRAPRRRRVNRQG